MSQHRTAALIVAAGQGARFGDALPKQFLPLAGRPLVAHAHAAFAGHPDIDAVLVVTAPEQAAMLEQAVPGARRCDGGVTRRESVANGLAVLAAEGFDRVLVHDAARPLVPSAVIDALVAALDTCPGAVPVLRVADTLARADGRLGEVVPRDALVRVQTPQAFRLADLVAAHRGWPADAEATDDAQMLRAAGATVATIEGSTMLDKITYPADLATAEALLAGRMVSRSATGFDVHRLEAGEELWLGGVLVPHDRGLSGHSDADVALHAITDALLGTIAAGDIGQHFPPSDPQWKGAASAQFLEHAVELVKGAGGVIDFVDLTLICEAPKIGPHRDAMRERIAALLQVAPAKVSVKATTTERLGFAGRGEGIAAQAIATIRIPDWNP
ncbi:bifunctional 2-C-methyl-D-erythritol 4-phosphate cytidylyltransferase/2-C-methyl-D-erythritol 2,4-cyclodiphosphate synthase [Sphingomonas baiyangensis]|uniref:Bifunctional enzyme IspD/IspF n=1 Tax=Sphingomonas baiyangensis TaxID=2572576 RepID=A0A4U1L308_9SPHN|nr:bifunctional 2-C-methyl-D-erythritol 4-phosphate cytidylyltransferase/2-C-methyl-D-erythritol 2,4-cyclodiphosphate synthase [Sphingomonas baiyangensis]TKD50456.1 bifunctional 2-C-methyl-D-erythritol 4-phosphate cytidylyltransferase/2-C-methyl-D-erythritol 2,4-cyclodiphosphate synthase [Sphingomonas baiyangensis]